MKTQRLEELAIKQSRQLIPVTPSMPKALVRELRCKTYFYKLSIAIFMPYSSACEFDFVWLTYHLSLLLVNLMLVVILIV